jgi:RNA methyltransferase, TrmH family
VRRITSRHNPLVERYRSAARGPADTLLLDGVHLIIDALAAGLRVREAAVAADAARVDIDALVGRLARAGVDTVAATTSVMAAISPVRSSSAIVALADRPGDAAERLYSGTAPLVIVAVDVQDPGNVGAIVRVAEAGGASGVVVAGASADPYGWKALRGSMGSALRLPIVTRRATSDLFEPRRHGCRMLAAVPRGGRSLFELDLTGPIAILIGGEGPGLPPGVLADADERVTIPMQTPVESLNAAVTAALMVYEARRQRAAFATLRADS